MVEHPPAFQRQHRSKTVVVAIWLIGIIAVVEFMFASIAYAPRILTALRSNNQSGISQASPAVPAETPATPAAQTIQMPVTRPLQKSPIKEITNPDHSPSDVPFQPVTQDSALQEGTALGIVSAKLDGADGGARKLLITIKANPKIPIDVPQVKVQVYFYDNDGTDIVASKAQVTSCWTSPPVDWKDGEPELLEVRYLPDFADSDIKFAGYIVAIYYKGDLQDYRAEPSRLTKQFPLKYYIGTDE